MFDIVEAIYKSKRLVYNLIMNINNKLVIDYFKQFGGNAGEFVDMLSRKAYFASLNDKMVYAAGQTRTAKELEQMLIIAGDLAMEGKLQGLIC
jgi:hypothetical protein